MTTRFVLAKHSQATRLSASPDRAASRTPSEIWSQTLSGCPSDTDSEVNRNSLSDSSWIPIERAMVQKRLPRYGASRLVGTGSCTPVAGHQEARIGAQLVARGVDR